MNKRLKYFGPVLIIAILLFLFMSACEPGGHLTILNQQNQTLQFFIAHVRSDGSTDGLTLEGSIPAKETKSFSITFLGKDWVNRIVIMNLNSEVIFSHDYKMAELDEIKWKIVIPP